MNKKKFFPKKKRKKKQNIKIKTLYINNKGKKQEKKNFIFYN